MNRQIEGVRGVLHWLAVRGIVPVELAATRAHSCPMEETRGEVRHDRRRTRPDRALVELLNSSAVRAAELLGFDVTDVDLDRATAVVMGKGRKQRLVPIGKTALRLVTSYQRGVRPLLVREATERALWLTRAGKRLPYHTPLKRLHAHADRLALPVAVTPHTFRRSCTTELIRGGANLLHVKELLGREHLATLQHYAKLTFADLKKTNAKCRPRERES